MTPSSQISPLKLQFSGCGRDASLATIQNGQAKTDGIAGRAAAATAMVANRANDGSSPALFFVPTSVDPYEWQITPGCTAGVFRQWPNVTPFGIQSSSQFRSEPPPALNSGIYAADFIELQTVGDLNSLQRSQDRSGYCTALCSRPRPLDVELHLIADRGQ